MQWITGSKVKLSKDMAEEQESQDITCQDTFGMIKRKIFHLIYVGVFTKCLYVLFK